MRQHHSYFNSMVDWINGHPVSQTYKTCDMHKWVRGNTYRRAQYQTYFKRMGFIENTQRGEWKILRKVPAWFTHSHASVLLFYKNETGGLDRNGILNQLYSGGSISPDAVCTVNPTREPYQTAEDQPLLLAAKVEKISPEESAFHKLPDSHKYTAQLKENLMLNAGYINSALCILDLADFIDPVQHARVLNIIVQLKDLQRTVEERLFTKRTTPII
jgi:hypothetical protein